MVIDKLIEKKSYKLVIDSVFLDKFQMSKIIFHWRMYFGNILKKISEMTKNHTVEMISFESTNSIGTSLSNFNEKSSFLKKTGIYKINCWQCTQRRNKCFKKSNFAKQLTLNNHKLATNNKILLPPGLFILFSSFFNSRTSTIEKDIGRVKHKAITIG